MHDDHNITTPNQRPRRMFDQDAVHTAPKAAPAPKNLFEQQSAPQQQAPPAPKNLFEDTAPTRRPPNYAATQPVPQRMPQAQSQNGSLFGESSPAPKPQDTDATRVVLRGAPQPPPAQAPQGSLFDEPDLQATRITTAQPGHPAAPANKMAAPTANGNGGGRGHAGRNPASGTGAGGNGGGRKGGKKPRKAKTAKAVFRNIAKAAFSVFCAVLIVASAMVVWVSGYVVESTENDDLVLNLESRAQNVNGVILVRDENNLDRWIEQTKLVGEANTYYTALTNISTYVVDALISTEDKDFETHSGFSLSRTVYAGLNDVLGLTDKSFGASTITQQLVKNLTGDAETDYMRKIREIFRAYGLEKNYTKDQILEAYLNTMPLSGTIVGVGAGAYEYFNKTPSELTLAESAMIVGITNHPYKYNPYTSPDACMARRNYALSQMLADGKITQSEYNSASNEPLGLYEGVRDAQNANNTVTSYYYDALYDQITSDLIANGVVETQSEASYMFYNGGLQIQSNEDTRIQSILEEVYKNAYTEGSTWPENVYKEVEIENSDGTASTVIVHPEGACVIMDAEGRVVAMVGGMGKKEESLSFNRATQATRSVGSTMKAIAAYPLGIEYNLITYSTRLQDSHCWWRGQKNYNADGTPNYDWPNNYGGSTTGEHQTIAYAIAKSTNTIAVRVGLKVGLDQMYEFAVDTLQITSLQNDENKDYNYSPLVLGGQYEGISPLEMCAAYNMYSNGGIYHYPRLYEKVLDADGNVIMSSTNYSIQAISEETAYIMNLMLQGVFTSSGGTAYGLGLNGMPAAGKTGTSSDDVDRWFIGSTPYYTAAVWWGYDNQNLTLNGVPTGSRNATTLTWREIMNQVHEGLEYKGFPEQPEGVVTASYCTESGLLAGDTCASTATGYYKADNVPDQCLGH